MALISGVEEAKILEIKQTEIHDKASHSIRENGWLPNLFRGIVGKAKEFLQNIIRKNDMPPKPTLDMDMEEFRTMQKLMSKVQKQAKEIKKLQEVVLSNLRTKFAETTDIFKGKERKALEKQIQKTEFELDEILDKLAYFTESCGRCAGMSFGALLWIDRKALENIRIYTVIQQ